MLIDWSKMITPEMREAQRKEAELAQAQREARELLLDRTTKQAAQTETLTLSECALMARAQMYDEWQAGQTYAKGKRVTYKGIVYEVQQQTTTSEVYPPDAEGVLALYIPLSTDGHGTLEDPYVWIYGMEVKAVIDDNHILVALRDQAISGIGSVIDQYGTGGMTKTEPKPSVLDEIAGFRPNVGSGKCSEDILDGGDSEENVILMIVPNMEERDYIEAFPAIKERVLSLGGSVNGESADNIAMPYISVTLPSEEAVLSMCDDQAIYRVDSDEEASLDAFFSESGTPSEPGTVLRLDRDETRSLHHRRRLPRQQVPRPAPHRTLSAGGPRIRRPRHHGRQQGRVRIHRTGR